MTTTAPEDPHRYASVALLVDLVTNTLDPGYTEATARRGDDRRHRWYDAPAVALGCLLIGFVLVVAYQDTHRAAPQSKKVHDSLVARVQSAQHGADALSVQLNDLSRQLASVRDSALTAAQRAALTKAELAAGLSAVTGPGLSIVLDEPPAAPPSASPGRDGTVPISNTSLITDRDVRSVVNELWADGAQAISVNDVRLTPTSAIRFAGEAVLVDFRAIMSPYTIRAIGDANRLITTFADSVVASRYQTLASARGIGFEFTQEQRLNLPAAASSTLRYAHPAPSPAPSGSSR